MTVVSCVQPTLFTLSGLFKCWKICTSSSFFLLGKLYVRYTGKFSHKQFSFSVKISYRQIHTVRSLSVENVYIGKLSAVLGEL